MGEPIRFSDTSFSGLYSRSASCIAVTLAIWVGILLLVAELPLSGAAFLVAETGLVLVIMRTLASEADRVPVTIFFAGALILFTAEVLFCQSTPQWLRDGVFDSPGYDLNARALLRHWQGLSVPSEEFRLIGLRRAGIAEWAPDDPASYAQVFGMSRYGYQLFVAVVYALSDSSKNTAIFANLPLAAATVAATFLLARALFASGRVAHLAAGLVTADPNLSVWSALLMRDVAIAFLASLGALASVRILRRLGSVRLNAVLGFGAAVGLTFLRFNVLISLAAAWLLVVLRGLPTFVAARGALLAVGLVLAGFGLIRASPDLEARWLDSLPGRVLNEAAQLAQRGHRAVVASASKGPLGDVGKVDVARREWYRNLEEQPLWLNLARAMARSVMGPFPWVAITHGISGTNYYELLYPGVSLWLLGIPAFLYALWRVPIRSDPAVLLCVVWMAIVTAIYIVGYGQLDGRSRLMIQPLLWLFAAKGFVLLGAGGLRGVRAGQFAMFGGR